MTSAELFSSSAQKPESIAIIGGGIAAISLTEQIFKVSPDAKVSLFCQDPELASRGSGNKQGAIYPLLQGSKSVIAEFYATCYDQAIDYYQSWLKAGLEFDHGFTGVLQQAMKPELEDRLYKIAQTRPEQCQYFSAEQSSEIAGIELPFPSIFFADAGWIWPQQFCQRLADKLSSQFDLATHLSCHVSTLSKLDNWQLHDKNGKQLGNFDAVVLCAGHQTNQFLQSQHVPLQSVRGQVSRLSTNTPLAKLKTVLCHKGYITPAQAQYQCFGATFVKDDNDETIRLSEQQANLAQLQKVYPEQTWANQLEQQDIIGDKAAIRAMSPDHIPIAGELFSDDWIRENVDNNTGKLRRLKPSQQNYPDSDLRGIYTMTGLGARGLTSAPMLAKHLTCIMYGDESPFNERLQKAISTKRFQVRQIKKLKNSF